MWANGDRRDGDPVIGADRDGGVDVARVVVDEYHGARAVEVQHLGQHVSLVLPAFAVVVYGAECRHEVVVVLVQTAAGAGPLSGAHSRAQVALSQQVQGHVSAGLGAAGAEHGEVAMLQR